MSFDPKKHVIRVQGGREYLPAGARLVWFRQEHPDWGIVTTPVEINLAPAPELKRPPYAIFQAQIFNAEGKLMATAHKYEDVKGFPDFLEKAETGAISRALSYCGFGTQFAPELEENDRFADSPRGGGRFATGPGAPRPMGGNGFGNRPGGGNAPNGPGGGGGNFAPSRPGMNGGGNNGGGRPGGSGGYDDERGGDAPFDAEAPRTNARGGAGAEDIPFSDEEAPAPAPRASAPASAAPQQQRLAAPTPPPPSAPVASAAPAPASGGGITRVKEPERDYDDPGGADDFDDEQGDPFADDDAPPAPARAAAPAPARPAQSRPAAAPVAEAAPDEPAAPPKPNKLAASKCSAEGCPNILSPSQLTISMNKFGKPVCMVHQKDPSVTGGVGAAAAAANTASAGNRRPAPQDSLL